LAQFSAFLQAGLTGDIHILDLFERIIEEFSIGYFAGQTAVSGKT
jgi:hypothetical protein